MTAADAVMIVVFAAMFVAALVCLAGLNHWLDLRNPDRARRVSHRTLERLNEQHPPEQ